MLQGIGGLEDIYKDIESIAKLEFRGAKKIPQKMLEHKDLADLSYKLATIKTNVELDRTINSLVNQKTNDQELLFMVQKN
jgi:DNA polymerase-1